MERTIIFTSPPRETTTYTSYYSPSRVVTYSNPVSYISPSRTYYSMAPVQVTTTTTTTNAAPVENKVESNGQDKVESKILSKEVSVKAIEIATPNKSPNKTPLKTPLKTPANEPVSAKSELKQAEQPAPVYTTTYVYEHHPHPVSTVYYSSPITYVSPMRSYVVHSAPIEIRATPEVRANPVFVPENITFAPAEGISEKDGQEVSVKENGDLEIKTPAPEKDDDGEEVEVKVAA
jgi:hypothetical protein